MKYRSLFAVLISIGILFSLLSCMERSPVRIYDESRISPAEVARISIPADIKVESVDGKRFKSLTDYILSTKEEIHVTPGEHEVVVRYHIYWAYDKKKNFKKVKHKEIKSEKIALKFNAERGGLYKLTHPELNDMSEAKKFAENPDIWIAKVGQFSDKEDDGTSVSRSVEISESRSYTEPEKPSTIKEDAALKEEWYSLSKEEKEELREWLEWKNMSDEEKGKFREWMNKNDKE